MGQKESMHTTPRSPITRGLSRFAAGLLIVLVSCGKGEAPERPDHPRLTPDVKMVDVTFHSVALNRDMQYRVVFPENLSGSRRLPVLYLLHGGGEGFRDWTNDSDVAGFAHQ